jgi:hypothetical protein
VTTNADRCETILNATVGIIGVVGVSRGNGTILAKVRLTLMVVLFLTRSPIWSGGMYATRMI